jgi:hypothetical protein
MSTDTKKTFVAFQSNLFSHFQAALLLLQYCRLEKPLICVNGMSLAYEPIRFVAGNDLS